MLDHPLSPGEWLALPEQHLRTIYSGGVWHDGTGELTRLRTLLHWYPDHIWRYLLRAQWRRIEQGEAFPGRCAEVGDELGSRVVAARVVREVMHLAFLVEREYMPYSKWLGTAFSRLRMAQRLEPALLHALAATDWPSRERGSTRPTHWTRAMYDSSLPSTASAGCGQARDLIQLRVQGRQGCKCCG